MGRKWGKKSSKGDSYSDDYRLTPELHAKCGSPGACYDDGRLYCSKGTSGACCSYGRESPSKVKSPTRRRRSESSGAARPLELVVVDGERVDVRRAPAVVESCSSCMSCETCSWSDSSSFSRVELKGNMFTTEQLLSARGRSPNRKYTSPEPRSKSPQKRGTLRNYHEKRTSSAAARTHYRPPSDENSRKKSISPRQREDNRPKQDVPRLRNKIMSPERRASAASSSNRCQDGDSGIKSGGARSKNSKASSSKKDFITQIMSQTKEQQKQIKSLEDELEKLRGGTTVDSLANCEVRQGEVEWRPGDIIGEGSFSTVYKGTYCGTEVAVKELKFKLSQDDKNYFRSEAALLQQLHHPRVVLLMGVCTTSTRPFMLLEYLAGGTLHTFIHDTTRERLDHAAYFAISKDIAQGMNYLHKHEPQVLHLDLKSMNVLLDTYSRAKIADFGFSILRRSRNANSGAQKGSIRGTPAWMAPELLTKGEVSVKCDVYSYAIILWEMLSASHPFKGFDVYQRPYRASNPSPRRDRVLSPSKQRPPQVYKARGRSSSPIKQHRNQNSSLMSVRIEKDHRWREARRSGSPDKRAQGGYCVEPRKEERPVRREHSRDAYRREPSKGRKVRADGGARRQAEGKYKSHNHQNRQEAIEHHRKDLRVSEVEKGDKRRRRILESSPNRRVKDRARERLRGRMTPPLRDDSKLTDSRDSIGESDHESWTSLENNSYGSNSSYQSPTRDHHSSKDYCHQQRSRSDSRHRHSGRHSSPYRGPPSYYKAGERAWLSPQRHYPVDNRREVRSDRGVWRGRNSSPHYRGPLILTAEQLLSQKQRLRPVRPTALSDLSHMPESSIQDISFILQKAMTQRRDALDEGVSCRDSEDLDWSDWH